MLSNNADLIAAALRGPQGPSDSGYYTGTIVAWDANTGLNTVMVNQVPLSNLKVIQQGVGVPYSVGDTVLIARKQTQYFIMGRVTSPGVGQSTLVSATVSADETTTSAAYTDLATFGPSVTVNIGASDRCLLMLSCRISCVGTATPPGNYIGGWMAYQISGASATVTGANLLLNQQVLAPSTGAVMGFSTSISGAVVLDQSRGLSPGLNTFTAKYIAMAGPAVGFRDRTITVIPL